MTFWVIPCNEKLYDHRAAFKNLDTIDWRQSTKVEEGDVVFIYVGKPTSSLMYKCEAIKTNILNPNDEDSKYILSKDLSKGDKYMRLKLIEKFDEGVFKREVLLKHGLPTVQGPCRVKLEFIQYIEKKH